MQSDALIGVSRLRAHLWPGRDGALVVGLTARQVGLAYLVVPMKAGWTEWYRFPPRAVRTD